MAKVFQERRMLQEGILEKRQGGGGEHQRTKGLAKQQSSQFKRVGATYDPATQSWFSCLVFGCFWSKYINWSSKTHWHVLGRVPSMKHHRWGYWRLFIEMRNFSRKPMMDSRAHVYIYIANTICLEKMLLTWVWFHLPSLFLDGEITSHAEHKSKLSSLSMWHRPWWELDGTDFFIMLLMKILHLGSLYHYLKSLLYPPGWLFGISSINSPTCKNHGAAPGCFTKRPIHKLSTRDYRCFPRGTNNIKLPSAVSVTEIEAKNYILFFSHHFFQKKKRSKIKAA